MPHAKLCINVRNNWLKWWLSGKRSGELNLMITNDIEEHDTNLIITCFGMADNRERNLWKSLSVSYFPVFTQLGILNGTSRKFIGFILPKLHEKSNFEKQIHEWNMLGIVSIIHGWRRKISIDLRYKTITEFHFQESTVQNDNRNTNEHMSLCNGVQLDWIA